MCWSVLALFAASFVPGLCCSEVMPCRWRASGPAADSYRETVNDHARATPSTKPEVDPTVTTWSCFSVEQLGSPVVDEVTELARADSEGGELLVGEALVGGE